MRRDLALVLALGLLLFAPGLLAPGFEGEEGRRALLAIDMLHTGDLVVPRLCGTPYLTKPPGYPWAVASLATLAGELSPLVARLPSLLASLATACLLVVLGRRAAPGNGRVGRAAALLWLVSPAAGEKAAVAETDTVLTLFVLLSVAALGAVVGPRPRTAPLAGALAGLALAGALMVKGPPALVFFAAAVVALLVTAGGRRRAVLGAAGIALVVGLAPLVTWTLLVLAHVDSEEAVGTWGRELARTNSGGLASYAGLWWRLLLGIPLACLPATAVLLARPRAARATPSPLPRAWLLAALLALGFFVLFPGARPRYAYPAAPLLALGAGWLVAERAVARRLAVGLGVLLAIFQLARAAERQLDPGPPGRYDELAAAIDAVVPGSEVLYDVAGHYDLMAHFESPVREVEAIHDAPPEAYVLSRPRRDPPRPVVLELDDAFGGTLWLLGPRESGDAD